MLVHECQVVNKGEMVIDEPIGTRRQDWFAWPTRLLSFALGYLHGPV